MAAPRLVPLMIAPFFTSLLMPGSAVYVDQTVEILDLSVPRFPKSGEDVVLTCRFKLGGPKHRLYTVNWWRGKDQFYTYKKNNFQPKHAYSFRGIDVKIEDSTEEMVVLRNVNEDTSGVYKCEVMGEGPAFRTAVDTMEMHVIVPPERLEIAHSSNRNPNYQYKVDDLINLNCTAYRVRPRPHLAWRINGQEVDRNNVQRYPDFEDHRGRVTSTLGLHFMAPTHFANRVAHITCVAFVEGHEFSKEEVLQLDPSAAFHLYSSGDWRVFHPLTALATLLFLNQTWNRWL